MRKTSWSIVPIVRRLVPVIEFRAADLIAPDDENSDCETLVELFDIPFDVPFKNATRKLNQITSRTSFREFIIQLSERMEVGRSLLTAIGYVPSYKPKNPKPKPTLLEEDEDWDALIQDVKDYRDESLAKKKGRGTIKPFVIAIIDTSAADGKEAGTKKVLNSILPDSTN